MSTPACIQVGRIICNRTDLEVYEEEEIPHRKQFRRLCRLVDEFETYITLNEPFIPNYGERYRNGEPISTAFVESTVNEVISRRMVKKQIKGFLHVPQ